jgi:hypothetical protein
MPYMKNGKRDYKTENEKYNSRPEQRRNRSERTIARNKAIADGTVSRGDGRDLDHIKPLSKGGGSGKSNLRAVSASSNRSFSRMADGSLKSQTSARERKRKK